MAIIVQGPITNGSAAVPEPDLTHEHPLAEPAGVKSLSDLMAIEEWFPPVKLAADASVNPLDRSNTKRAETTILWLFMLIARISSIISTFPIASLEHISIFDISPYSLNSSRNRSVIAKVLPRTEKRLDLSISRIELWNLQ